MLPIDRLDMSKGRVFARRFSARSGTISHENIYHDRKVVKAMDDYRIVFRDRAASYEEPVSPKTVPAALFGPVDKDKPAGFDGLAAATKRLRDLNKRLHVVFEKAASESSCEVGASQTPRRTFELTKDSIENAKQKKADKGKRARILIPSALPGDIRSQLWPGGSNWSSPFYESVSPVSPLDHQEEEDDDDDEELRGASAPATEPAKFSIRFGCSTVTFETTAFSRWRLGPKTRAFLARLLGGIEKKARKLRLLLEGGEERDSRQVNGPRSHLGASSDYGSLEWLNPNTSGSSGTGVSSTEFDIDRNRRLGIHFQPVIRFDSAIATGAARRAEGGVLRRRSSPTTSYNDTLPRSWIEPARSLSSSGSFETKRPRGGQQARQNDRVQDEEEEEEEKPVADMKTCHLNILRNLIHAGDGPGEAEARARIDRWSRYRCWTAPPPPFPSQSSQVSEFEDNDCPCDMCTGNGNGNGNSNDKGDEQTTPRTAHVDRLESRLESAVRAPVDGGH